MKNITLSVVFLFLASVAMAAPFLVCDAPQENEVVTEYEIFQDGVSLGKTFFPMHFDLKDVVPGAYNFTATAINEWGSSPISDPYISPLPTAQPLNINMTP
jgi:hypothetical protein